MSDWQLLARGLGSLVIGVPLLVGGFLCVALSTTTGILFAPPPALSPASLAGGLALQLSGVALLSWLWDGRWRPILFVGVVLPLTFLAHSMTLNYMRLTDGPELAIRSHRSVPSHYLFKLPHLQLAGVLVGVVAALLYFIGAPALRDGLGWMYWRTVGRGWYWRAGITACVLLAAIWPCVKVALSVQSILGAGSSDPEMSRVLWSRLIPGVLVVGTWVGLIAFVSMWGPRSK